MADRSLTDSKPHYFIVLSPNPTNTSIIIFSVFTSQLEKVRKRNKRSAPGTLIEIGPSEYSQLVLQSIIDCNSVQQIPLNELINKYTANHVQNCDPLPSEILDKIIAGVMKSRNHSKDLKRRIDPTFN